MEDIADALGSRGLTLEAKGGGLVAGNAASYVKFSRLGLTLSANARARIRTASTPARPLLTVDGVDIVRALHRAGWLDREDVTAAVDDARMMRAVAQARRASAKKQLLKRLGLATALTSLFYCEPSPARGRDVRRSR